MAVVLLTVITADVNCLRERRRAKSGDQQPNRFRRTAWKSCGDRAHREKQFWINQQESPRAPKSTAHLETDRRQVQRAARDANNRFAPQCRLARLIPSS